jgi:hypothetical protein
MMRSPHFLLFTILGITSSQLVVFVTHSWLGRHPRSSPSCVASLKVCNHPLHLSKNHLS